MGAKPDFVVLKQLVMLMRRKHVQTSQTQFQLAPPLKLPPSAFIFCSQLQAHTQGLHECSSNLCSKPKEAASSTFTAPLPLPPPPIPPVGSVEYATMPQCAMPVSCPGMAYICNVMPLH